MTDLVIRGGMVVDGSGAPGRPGTVVVAKGQLRILEPGAEPPPAARMIHAGGMVVAPGFIDLHSHSGLWLLHEPEDEPKVRQGVTTEVIGVDGLSYAPLTNAQDLAALFRMNAGLDGRPPIALDWDTVASYLGRFDNRASVNVALLIGNSALRICAVGWDDVPADHMAMADMRAMLREGMAEGAFGLSTGLDYPPGSYATTEELADLTAVAGDGGGFYHTHVRYDLGDRFLDPFREALAIGEMGHGPVHLTHFYHRESYPGGHEPMLALVDDARAAGHDVTFDTYPSEWASTRLLIQLPQWVQAGGPTALLERLADGAVRDRLRAEMSGHAPVHGAPRTWADVRMGAFAAPANEPWEGRTVAEASAELGRDPVDVVCDLLLAEDLGINQVTPGPWSESLPHFVAHPVGMVGTDSTFIGRKPSPRTYGSYPRILGQFVRDERRLSLEEAIRKMTAAPAARLGLRDRGLLRDGYAADVVVFDPERIRSNATYDAPRQFPDGIEHVLVNGVAVVDGGRHTGALPGRALRHGRD
ncbi:MAG TPA: amidohydrolase family protein [Candidatus Limnocylindria bacterium]